MSGYLKKKKESLYGAIFKLNSSYTSADTLHSETNILNNEPQSEN